MNTVRVITVDDEPLARERVSALVRDAPGLELVGEASNGIEALDLISALEPDLVLIDVEMPELSGFGVVAALDTARVPGVVFVTAFERYALQAFEVGAIDYLHKPVTRERFRAAIDRARQRLDHAAAGQRRGLVDSAAAAERSHGTRTRFVVRQGHAHRFVPVDQVDWLDVADNYLQLHAGGRVYLHRGTMKDAETELDPTRFVRIHRRAMVAVDRIERMHAHPSGNYVLELRDGTRLRSSRHYADRVRALLR